MTPFPREPTGTHPIVNTVRALIRIAKESRLIAGRNVTIDRTTNGLKINAEPSGRGGGGLATGMFRAKEFRLNYIIARAWDGTNEGGIDVLIAKQPGARGDIESETIQGIEITYVYDSADPNQRHATFGEETEIQVLNPRWFVDSIIYAIRMPNTGIVADDDFSFQPVVWADTSPRAWARRRE